MLVYEIRDDNFCLLCLSRRRRRRSRLIQFRLRRSIDRSISILSTATKIDLEANSDPGGSQ